MGKINNTDIDNKEDDLIIPETKIKTHTTKICDVSETFASVYINGWYCAVNFSNPKIQSKQYKRGMDITFEYEGDLEKDTNGCFNLKILPLK